MVWMKFGQEQKWSYLAYRAETSIPDYTSQVLLGILQQNYPHSK